MATRKSNSPRKKGPAGRKRRKEEASRQGWLAWVPQARQLLGERRLTLDLIPSQLRGLREALEGQVEAASRMLEGRVDRLLEELEERATRRLLPLLARAEMVRRADMAPYEDRLARTEARVSRLIEEGNELALRTKEVERDWQALRAQLTDRLVETAERIAEVDALRARMEELGHHLDSISKEQVAKAVEATKLHDRVLRLEMRIADISRQEDSLAGLAKGLAKQISALAGKVDRELPQVAASVNDLLTLKTDIENLVHDINGLNDVQQAQRCELERVSSILRERENSLDARLGDILERQKRAGAELASVAARLRQLQDGASAASSLGPDER